MATTFEEFIMPTEYVEKIISLKKMAKFAVNLFSEMGKGKQKRRISVYKNNKFIDDYESIVLAAKSNNLNKSTVDNHIGQDKQYLDKDGNVWLFLDIKKDKQ